MKLKPHPVLGTLAALLLGLPAYSIVLRHIGSLHGDPTLRYAALGAVGEGSGVLVAPRWIVTSGDAAAAITPFDSNVLFGCALARGEWREAAVDLVLPHPETPDLALLRLAEHVPGVPPMRLYGKGDEAGLDLLHCDRDGPPATTTVERVEGSALQLDVPAVAGPVLADEGKGLTLVGLGTYRGSARTEGRALRISHFREWIRSTMSANAETPAGLGERIAVEGELPDGEDTDCARAFFAAYATGDLERLRAFELGYSEESRLAELDKRLAVLRRQMQEWGPLAVRAYATDGDGHVWVLTHSQRMDCEITFHFAFAGEPERLVELTTR